MSVIGSNILAGASGSQGYQISRSVRLRSSASAYFNRTPASAGNRNTWTWSGWIKRGALGSSRKFFLGTNSTGGTNSFYAEFNASDVLNIGDYVSPSYVWQLTTTQVFRDPSAWYHLVICADTTQATSSNRIKVYVNGAQVTAFSTASYPTQNYNTIWNSATLHTIGDLNGASLYFDGYMTEINFIDGQALTPTSFGQFNSVTGVWQPLKYTGTYGTNGFYLNFSDNSNNTATTIGKDYSGNGNNWTPNNISVTAGATYDSMIDVPTLWGDGGNGRGNYATMNSLAVGPYATLSDGNLKISGASATDSSASYSTIGMTTGKWYFEVTNTGSGYGASTFGYALVADVLNAQALLQTSFAGYRTRGNTYGTVTSTFATWEAGGEVIGVAVDCDNGAIYFARNNTWINSGDPTSGSSKTGAITTYTGGSKTLYGGGGVYSTSSQNVTLNFGQRPFAYTPPTGFKALNTQNLPAPTIGNGANYMAATTYTGNGGTQSIVNTVNGVSFKPDLVWVKGRSIAYNNYLEDSVRGVGKDLSSNLTDAEATYNLLSSFNSNGFTVFTNGTYPASNENGTTYVGWQWNAGSGTTSSNTSGSITSTVSVNATAGFSIVTYTGTGANATVGHGLGVAPSMIIIKNRTLGTENWAVYHTSTGAAYWLLLSGTNAAINNTTIWQNTSPTSSVMSLGPISNSNVSGSNFVAYCFSAVAGYSAFGSYTGNGNSSDGPFVYLGFRPRWIMVKSSTSVTDWKLLDTSRNPYNSTNSLLGANISAAEDTNVVYDFDILSNGFKIRNAFSYANTNGATYIYAAFSEVGFKYALGR